MKTALLLLFFFALLLFLNMMMQTSEVQTIGGFGGEGESSGRAFSSSFAYNPLSSPQQQIQNLRNQLQTARAQIASLRSDCINGQIVTPNVRLQFVSLLQETQNVNNELRLIGGLLPMLFDLINDLKNEANVVINRLSLIANSNNVCNAVLSL
jgi:TolA-binding protein